MFFIAPPLAPDVKQANRRSRIVSGAWLSGAAVVLLLVNVLLFFGCKYFVTSPQGLYHRVWQAAAENIYDPAALKDWKQWEHKYDSQIHSNDDAVKYSNEMLKSLGDRYTFLQGTQAVKAEDERSEGHFTGVGITFGVKLDAAGKPVNAADGKPLPEASDDGYPLVKQVIRGGPAKQSGVQAGDAITSVNGKPTQGLSVDQLVQQIRGEAGTQVIFGLRRNGQDSTMSVTRQTINVPVVETKKLPGDIGYLRLEDFAQYNSADEFKKGLEELKSSKGLIIDLRGNPGGFINNSLSISSFFIEEGKIVTIKSRIPGDGYETKTTRLTKGALITETTTTGSSKVVVESGTREPFLVGNKPVVVLVDGNTASAAEMTTGALKDNKRVTVIGTRTFGKGIGQSLLPMPNGTRLHITSLRYFTPNGTWLGDGGNSESHGIEPNIEVQPAKDDLQFGEQGDNQLQKGIEWLQSQIGKSSAVPAFVTVKCRSC